MSIRILRDPNNPLGGHALLIVPNPGSGAPPETRLRFLREEDRMFLGNQGWAASEEVLGPFALVPQGDELAVALGPDIVNAMEPFQKLTIDALDLKESGSLGWPDDILPLRKAQVRRRGIMTPGAGLSQKPETRKGGISTGSAVGQPAPNPPEPSTAGVTPGVPENAGAGQDQNLPDSNPTVVRPTPKEPPAPAPPAARPSEAPSVRKAPTSVEDEPVAPKKEADERPDKNKSNKPLILALCAVVILAGAGAAGFFLLGDDASESKTAELTCDVQSVAASDEAKRWEMVELCVKNAKAREALPLVERLVADGHGAAQFQLAKWLDPEEVASSPMDARNPIAAMRLYDGARNAGIDDATPLIKRLCEGLDGQRNLNAQMTHKKYCEGS